MKNTHNLKTKTGKIAITGISGIFPGSDNIEQFCSNILNKKEAIIDIPPERWVVPHKSIISSKYLPDTACSKKAGIIKDFKFDPSNFNIDKDLLSELDPLHKMVLAAGKQAMSECFHTKEIREKTGVIIAAISLPTEKTSEIAWQICMDICMKNKSFLNPKLLTKADALSTGVVSVPAALTARAFGLKGGAYTLDAACASSLFSIKLACDELLTGNCDMMIAGGVARPDSLYTQIGFTQLKALSPSGRCSPFDKSADGLVVGEGTGLLVLKRMEDAVKCGDKIWGIICGTGLSNDIEGSLISPASEGQVRAMETAFKNAGWCPGDVQLVECHGSGTPVGDQVELNSMKTLWEDAGCLDKACSIGSIKSMTGHLLTAAGAAGIIKTLIGMDKKILPPSLNFSSPPGNSPLHNTNFKVQTEPEEWKPSFLINNKNLIAKRRAGISGFGFGGINAHILVEEFKPDNGKKYFQGNAYFRDNACFRGNAKNPSTNNGNGKFTHIQADIPPASISDNEIFENLKEKDEIPGNDIPIAIIGMETIIGSAHNLKEFQRMVLSGNGYPPWNAYECEYEKKSENENKQIDGYWINEISSFPGEFHIPPNQINDLLPQHLLMLKAAKKALADAGIPMRPLDNEPARTKFGAVLGIEFDYKACDFHIQWRLKNSDKTINEAVNRMFNGAVGEISDGLTSGRTLGALGGIVASRIAREFKIGGPCFTVSAGAASGLKAVEIGIRSLKAKETDIFLCGSVDMAGDVRELMVNNIVKPFAKYNDISQYKLFPGAFDKKSSGPIPCEGAAAIVLKPLDMAEKDGNRIYGIIQSSGSASGAAMACEMDYENSSYQALKNTFSMEEIYSLSLNRTMQNAGISFDSLGLYEAHGSGNKNEDRIEAIALHKYINAQKNKENKNNKNDNNNTKLPCALGSAMAMAGDAKAVSGLLSLIKSALALYNGIIPPVRGFTSPEFGKWEKNHFYIPKYPCFWIKNKSEEKRCACAASMTMDGACSHFVLKEYVKKNTPEMKSSGSQCLSSEKITSSYKNINPDKNISSYQTISACQTISAGQTTSSGKNINSDQTKICPVKTKKNFPLEIMTTGLFIAEADSENKLVEKLELLNIFIKKEIKKIHGETKTIHNKTGKNTNLNINPAEIAGIWFKRWKTDHNKKLCIAIIAKNINYLVNDLIPKAIDSVQNQKETKITKGQDQGIFYTLNPLGKKGRIAFLYPGSGNHFPGMGRKIGVLFPEILQSMEDQGISLKKCLLPEIYYPMRVSWENGWEKDALDKIKAHSHNMIFGQVLFGSLVTRVSEKFKIKPNAAIGHSLGETASLFALKVWDNPEEMLERMEKSDLFTKKLAGEFTAAAKLWNLPNGVKPEWSVAAVNRSKKELSPVIKNYDHLYILIVNTFDETIIGGSDDQLKQFIKDTKCGALFLDGVVSVHCAVAESVKEEYLGIHKFVCHARPDIDFYSCSLGKKYIPETQATAMSILNQAIYGFDYTKVINAAWNDGIRMFIEMGPGASCTEFVKKILNNKDHAAFSMSSKNEDEEISLLKVLAQLACHRAKFDISPLFISENSNISHKIHINTDNNINTDENINNICAHLRFSEVNNKNIPAMEKKFEKNDFEKNKFEENKFEENKFGENKFGENKFLNCADGIKRASIATSHAHEKFLSLTQENMEAFENQFKALSETATALIDMQNKNYSPALPHDIPPDSSPQPLFTKQMCMEFATGSLAAVLGEKFKIIDSYPVRVRLPDAPLMLVDRIMEIKGEILSLKSGTIITQHDVKKDAWYLDGGRAPVSISIEAGQADLFLCSWLGIDHAVKGKRRYRLLDAKITFHRHLPVPGETIEYRIKIDKFLKQGEIYLFFFHYKGYINKEIFISMRDGCAGFFTENETKNSMGIIIKNDDTSGISGVNKTQKNIESCGTTKTDKTDKTDKIHARNKQNLNFGPFVSLKKESYNDDQLQALRKGELEKCFGKAFKGIILGKNLRLPNGRMHLIDRVTEFDPSGGKSGLGVIAAELDIKPDVWFLTCHFIDDKVMPGTLMYECCAHTLRIFTQRIGFISKNDSVYYDIIPGLESNLKCRGPVTPETKKAEYKIEIKEMGYDKNKNPYFIADAHMFADGHRIVFYQNMGMKIKGLLPGEIENLWK